MLTDLSIRPVGALATMAVSVPVSGAPDDAVTTELPPRQSVTAVEAIAPAQLAAETSNPTLSHQVILDAEAASLVYRVVEERSEKVVSQYPDDAMLRRRAYFHALDNVQAGRTSGTGTDRKA